MCICICMCMLHTVKPWISSMCIIKFHRNALNSKEVWRDKNQQGNTKEKLDYITVFTVPQTNKNKSTKLKAKGPISLLNHIQHINCSGWGQCRSWIPGNPRMHHHCWSSSGSTTYQITFKQMLQKKELTEEKDQLKLPKKQYNRLKWEGNQNWSYGYFNLKGEL